jgi:hypothetical protein
LYRYRTHTKQPCNTITEAGAGTPGSASTSQVEDAGTAAEDAGRSATEAGGGPAAEAGRPALEAGGRPAAEVLVVLRFRLHDTASSLL